MIKTLRNAWKLPELRNKILFVIFALLIFRVGAAIPVPYINTEYLQQYMAANSGTIFGLLNTLSGSALSRATLFALSIQPYINASIIIQLLTIAIPALERLAKDGGEEGKKKIQAITRYTTLGIGLLQGFGYYTLIKSYNLLENTSIWTAVVIVITFTAGAVFLMWLGEQITEHGVGNGISIILFTGIVSRGPALVHTLYTGVRNYFTDRGKEVRVQMCFGIYVLTPEDCREADIDHMLDYARVAEKKVRETRKEGYEFYNPDQWEKGKRVAEIINHLPGAIRAGNILVWYQPQVNGETGEITGAEALCRWDHERLGWLYPPAFIDSLEESGMIYDLDCYVWEKVCADLERWNGQGKHRSVAVNVSRCDLLRNSDLPGHFRGLTEAHGLTPDQLRIEITETAFVENPADLISLTKKLQEYGFEVEMDDFGSGYSSLHMLKEVPVNRIKLDLHFLTESGDPEKGRTIISYMIRMIRDLGMKMITEGVETEEQAQFLLSKGCSDMQGFRFYRPMPVEEFEKADAG